MKLSDCDLPGKPRSRVLCSACGEGINDSRESFSETGEILAGTVLKADIM